MHKTNLTSILSFVFLLSPACMPVVNTANAQNNDTYRFENKIMECVESKAACYELDYKSWLDSISDIYIKNDIIRDRSPESLRIGIVKMSRLKSKDSSELIALTRDLQSISYNIMTIMSQCRMGIGYDYKEPMDSLFATSRMKQLGDMINSAILDNSNPYLRNKAFENIIESLTDEDLNHPVIRIELYSIGYRYLKSRSWDQNRQGGLGLGPELSNNNSTATKGTFPRNLVSIHVNYHDEIFLNRTKVDLVDLNTKLRDTISELIEDDTSRYKRLVINLKSDRSTSYKRYVDVYTVIEQYFADERNKWSLKIFGEKFDALDPERKKKITDMIPVRISEGDPMNR